MKINIVDTLIPLISNSIISKNWFKNNKCVMTYNSGRKNAYSDNTAVQLSGIALVSPVSREVLRPS